MSKIQVVNHKCDQILSEDEIIDVALWLFMQNICKNVALARREANCQVEQKAALIYSP